MTPPAYTAPRRPEIVTGRSPRRQARLDRPGDERRPQGRRAPLHRHGADLPRRRADPVGDDAPAADRPRATLIRPAIFDRLLSAYGVTAVLLFAVPLLLGLITYIVPLQIGARGVALPRLNALSYWLYLPGALTIYASFL